MNRAYELAKLEAGRTQVHRENPIGDWLGGGISALTGGKKKGIGGLFGGGAKRRKRKTRRIRGRGTSGITFSKSEAKSMLQMYTMIGLMNAVRGG